MSGSIRARTLLALAITGALAAAGAPAEVRAASAAQAGAGGAAAAASAARATAAGPAAGPALDAAAQREADRPRHLLLRYASFSIGRDGVERETRHANRMVRTADTVWIEREWPAALRESREHGHAHGNDRDGDASPSHGGHSHAGHKHAHDETLNAPLLLQRDAAGGIDVQSVLRERRRIIHVDLAHHGNVGYGGSWAAAWSLIDPRALAGMRRVGAPTGGMQRYESRDGETTTQVDWDVAGQYARRISVRDAHGTQWRTLTATPRPMPAVLPWQSLSDYSHGDYSDLLD